MSLVLRSNINRRLTVQEMDGNFTYLENLAQTASGQKRAVYKVTNQSSGGLVLQEISNNTGISFTFTRIDVGFFDIPEFDTNNYSLDGKTCNLGMDCFFSNEDQKMLTYDYRNSQLSDDAFEFGGWIIIEKLT